MVFSSLRTSLIALVVSAVAVSAVPSLSVTASVPAEEVNGLENLKVTTTITNTGDETLQLLNDPRGVLSSFPEHSFTISDSDGVRPSFNGARVRYSPSYVISLNEPEDFTVIAPGASLNVTHDLSAAYDFTKPGTGDYSIEPSNLFTYVDDEGNPKELYATVEHAADVNLSGNLVVSRDEEENFARFIRCSSYRRRQIYAAAAGAQSYSSRAYRYLRGIRWATPRYRTWFGAYTVARKNLVQRHFQLISSRRFSSFTYDCGCNKSWYAYVYAGQPGKIYLCKAFWTIPNVGDNSKAGTLVHEASHFTINGGTGDYAYGKPASMALARRNPWKAVKNAENHLYFAENQPYMS